jgi:hypothetical protein
VQRKKDVTQVKARDHSNGSDKFNNSAILKLKSRNKGADNIGLVAAADSHGSCRAKLSKDNRQQLQISQ